MKISCSTPKLEVEIGRIGKEISRFATYAMKEAVIGLKQDLRAQVIGAGLGERLAKTWQGEVYPLVYGRNSLNPSGYVRSKAPAIIDSFSRGVTIRPAGGHKFLWIPTKNVPKQRGRVNRRGQVIRGGAMPPEEVEAYFNTELDIVKGKGGELLAYIDVVRGMNGSGYRQGTSRRTAAGRIAKPVLMFVLVPTVRMPKLIDLQSAAEKWARRYPQLVADQWS